MDMDRFYPFDTGALKSQLYGNRWSKRLDPIERFLVGPARNSQGPRWLVKFFFGSNSNYMKGTLSTPEGVSLPDPASVLADFLKDNIKGVDQRQYRIECQRRGDFGLADLIWVGYPDTQAFEYGLIFDKFQLADDGRFVYDTFRAAPPKEMAILLQAEALKFARKKFPELEI